MHDVLNAMKPGLVSRVRNVFKELLQPATEVPEVQEFDVSNITLEAQDLLRKVANVGVPTFTTENLRKIGKENGIPAEAGIQPEAIIASLREKADA